MSHVGRRFAPLSLIAVVCLAGCKLEAKPKEEALDDGIATGVQPVAPARRPRPEKPPPERTDAAVEAAGQAYVLAVGVDRYTDPKIPALRYAEADARSVFRFFATSKRSLAESDRVKILRGQEATRRNVLRAIREGIAAKATRPEDLVVIYFAGHGFADARTTYLACVDTELDDLGGTAISARELADVLGEVRAGWKLVVTDACHAGGIEAGGDAPRFRGIGGVAIAPGAATSPSKPSTPSADAPPGRTVCIGATGPNELSAEDESLGQGVFTLALVNGLSGEADADADDRVTDEELQRYLEREVPALAARSKGKQTPVVQATPGSAFFLTRAVSR